MGSKNETELARTAGMIGEPARAAMLAALLRGEALPAGELARHAGVTPQTASEHLARLVESGLITRRQSGRHRYYALAGEDVAAALEALARIVSPRADLERGMSQEDRALRFARTCYDHLAGRLGILLADTLLKRGLISKNGYDITGAGEQWLGTMDIDVSALRQGRRTLARPCLDWSERRDHLAGAVGAAITATMLERRWLVRLEGTRAVRLTLRGREGLIASSRWRSKRERLCRTARRAQDRMANDLHDFLRRLAARRQQHLNKETSMLGRIMKLVRRAKAPQAMYLALHPIKGARMWRAARKPKNVRALTGAGAAVLAVPIGFWLARRRR